MSLDGNALLASLVVSSIGFVFFAYGKKMKRLPQMLVGVLLMGFPYFVSNLALMAGITVALIGGFVVMMKLGM